MRRRRAILARFRHWIRLVPNDVTPQQPAGIPEGKGKHPGLSDEIFRPQPFVAAAVASLPALLLIPTRAIERAPDVRAATAIDIAIPHVHPARAILAEHAADLIEDSHQARNEFLRRSLESDLPFAPIVA